VLHQRESAAFPLNAYENLRQLLNLIRGNEEIGFGEGFFQGLPISQRKASGYHDERLVVFSPVIENGVDGLLNCRLNKRACVYDHYCSIRGVMGDRKSVV